MAVFSSFANETAVTKGEDGWNAIAAAASITVATPVPGSSVTDPQLSVNPFLP